MESTINETDRPGEKPIDREKTCPLLLRVFCAQFRHHDPREYRGGTSPANELQIYTWMDATLKELTSLVKEVNADARRKGTTFEFSIVFPDLRMSTYKLRPIGTTQSGVKGPDDGVSLGSRRFVIGDYIDIAITPPGRASMGGGGGGMRGPPPRGRY